METEKLDPQIKARWVAALRSGNYEQARGRLCYVRANENQVLTEKYCCLGVLCEIAVADGVIAKSTENPRHGDGSWARSFFDPNNTEDRATGDLPGKVAKWAYGLSQGAFRNEYSTDPLVRIGVNDERRLSGCNDTLGLDFNQIADLIEKSL